MKIRIEFITLLILATVLTSCETSKEFFYKKNDLHSFGSFLQRQVNDTTTYEIPALEIIDRRVYSLLDSVILLTKECKYFDERVPYLHAFEIFSRKAEDGSSFYSIDTNQSIEESLDLLFKEHLEPESPINKGVFYYKGFLFSIPIYNNEIADEFDFCKTTDNNYRIHASRLPNDAPYPSYLNFTRGKEGYFIRDNEICK